MYPSVLQQPAEFVELPPPGPYLIGPADTLHITVYKPSDMSVLFDLNPVLVMPDGKISVPLVGDVDAAGLTPTQLRDQVTDGLKNAQLHPVVNVMVVQAGRAKVYVLGEVKTAGVYRIDRDTSAVEALAMAGGVTDNADLTRIVLLRGSAEGADGKGIAPGVAGSVDVENLLKHADVAQNVQLRTGDVLYVPPDYIARSNRVFAHLANMIAPFAQLTGTITQAYIVSLVRRN